MTQIVRIPNVNLEMQHHDWCLQRVLSGCISWEANEAKFRKSWQIGNDAPDIPAAIPFLLWWCHARIRDNLKRLIFVTFCSVPGQKNYKLHHWRSRAALLDLKSAVEQLKHAPVRLLHR